MTDLDVDPWSYPACSYPTSSLRDEPYFPAPASSSSSSLSPSPSPSTTPTRPVLDPVYNRYAAPPAHEVVPGVRADGVLTAKHPLVDAFIAALPSTAPRDGLRPAREAWWTKRLRAVDVRDVLRMEDGALGDRGAEAVFALAALKLLYQFRHPKHFTLWGRESGPRTARRVQKVLYASPSPITSPVGWAGTHEQLWLVHGLQKSIFAAAPPDDGEAASNGMVLRKRKASAGAGAGVGGGASRKRARGEDDASASFGEDVEEEPRETRRSARQRARAAPSQPHAHSPLRTPDAAPDTAPLAPSDAPALLSSSDASPSPAAADARAAGRARSASSAATAVSAGTETCVEPDTDGLEAEEVGEAAGREGKIKGKGKKEGKSRSRKGGKDRREREREDSSLSSSSEFPSPASAPQTQIEVALEVEELRVRTSTRVRRLAPKKAEAVAMEREEAMANGLHDAGAR